MKIMDRVDRVGETEMSAADLLRPLVDARPEGTQPGEPIAGVVIGQLIALADEGRSPLVTLPGQIGSAAVRGRSTVDLYGAHIGCEVVVAFEDADMRKPIIIGVLRGGARWPLEQRPGQVNVDADGERLVVTAQNQLVLRCGKASITLTKTGKVLIEGAYISTRSSGVNRIKGGSIQLN
jgi:hypothetical protein